MIATYIIRLISALPSTNVMEVFTCLPNLKPRLAISCDHTGMFSPTPVHAEPEQPADQEEEQQEEPNPQKWE